jgi:zinc protease
LRRDDPDFFKVATALSYLGEHRQSNGLLFNQLREKRGLNYGDYAYAEHFVQDSDSTLPLPNVAWSQQMASLWIRPVEPANGVFAARAAVHFVRQLLARGLSAADLDRTKGFLMGYTRLWEQTDQRRLGYAIDSAFYGTPDYLTAYRTALQAMTAEDVNAALRRHLAPEKLNFVFVAKDADALAKSLKEGSPSPIQYATPKPDELLVEDKAIATERLPLSPERVEVLPVSGFMER